MTTFKEFINLAEAGPGIPGNASSGTSLQRNRPGSEKVFSPNVNYGGGIKDRQQEDIVWKNGIFSHVLHMHSSNALIEQDGGFFLLVSHVMGYSDGRPWHDDAIKVLQDARVLGATPETIPLEVYELHKLPRHAYDMPHLIKQQNVGYVPVNSVDQDDINDMIQQQWMLPRPQPIIIHVKAYRVDIGAAQLALANLTDHRNRLNMFYNTMSSMGQSTLSRDTGVSYLTPGN